MNGWIAQHEPWIRIGVFAGLFAIFALWELALPRRVLRERKSQRWLANLSLFALDAALVRLLFPLAGVGIALGAAERGIGVLNHLALPPWLAVIAGVLLLDLAIYWQHRLFHQIPVLWRLHKVHHTDLDFDLTTGVRFHPLEIVLSMLIKFALIALLGPPWLAVLLFEVVLNGTALFNHGNIAMPVWLDRYLRLVVVTPDMHRVHHSVKLRETNSNYGFNIPWWDRLFGSYRAQPRDGHLAMDIGLEAPREQRQLGLRRLLALPFLRIGQQPAR